jgi:hypothetical protein
MLVEMNASHMTSRDATKYLVNLVGAALIGAGATALVLDSFGPIAPRYMANLAHVNNDSIPDVVFKRDDNVYVLFGQTDGTLLSQKQLEQRHIDSLVNLVETYVQKQQ